MRKKILIITFTQQFNTCCGECVWAVWVSWRYCEPKTKNQTQEASQVSYCFIQQYFLCCLGGKQSFIVYSVNEKL